MTIRSKAIITLGGVSLVLVIILYAVSIFIVERNLLSLEEENVRYRLEQIAMEFEVEAAYLAAVNRDWASWDETYKFVGSADPGGYVAENISDDVFEYLRINIFAVYDERNKLYYFYYLPPDHKDGAWTSFEYFFKEPEKYLPDSKPLAEKEARVGLAVMEGRPILVSERPILKSDFSGPPRGRLLLGRLLDRAAIDAFGDKHGVKLSLENMDSELDETDPFMILERGPKNLTAILVLGDISGRPALALRMTQDRATFNTGWQALKSYAVIIAVITVVFAALLIIFLEKLVLGRLSRVFKEIDRIAKNRDFNGRLNLGRQDEFGILAGNINQLLATLADLQKDKLERQLEVIVGNVQSGAMIFVRRALVYLNDEQGLINGPVRLGLSYVNYRALYVHPFDREALDAVLAAADGDRELIKPDAVIRCFKFMPGYQGEPAQKWVRVTAQRLEYQNEPAVLINMIDITKAKTLEQILLSREKMASLGHVAAGIAHEIRNPLMGVGLTIDNLNDYFDNGEDRPELREMLDEAREAAKAIGRVVDRVLDFARSSDLHLSEMDIREPITAAVKLSQALARKSNVVLETIWPEALPQIRGDSHLLMEVFVNLISNSIQAMAGSRHEGRIIITIAGGTEQVLEIKVIDSGPGIPERAAADLFEPFFTTKPDGSGLGLAICRRIITDHGGTIELTFPALSGAAFLIILPTVE